MKNWKKTSLIIVVGLILILLTIVIVDPLPKIIRYQINQGVVELNIPGEEIQSVENNWIANTPIRIYADKQPYEAIVLYVPGGAFIAGNLDSHDNICRYLSKNLSAKVISVNYRKAPEHKFPAGSRDVEKVLNWIFENELQGEKLFLIGDSGGANLVAGLAPMYKSIIDAQVLVNPILDLREESAGYQNYGLFVDWYLESKSDAEDPKASPILAEEFNNVPNTYIITCSEDYLKQDGDLYYSKLKEAGVDVQIMNFDGLGHLADLWAGAAPETDSIRKYVVKKLQFEISKAFTSEALKIRKVANNTYVHISYLNDPKYGKVACNGMVVNTGGETVIYDTPADSSASLQLISWIKDELKSEINVIIPTHFHYDCLGTLNIFHDANIPSMASNLTISLASSRYSVLPQQGFEKYYNHQVGNEVVISDFIGGGHTQDNIVGYYEKDSVLFGGCLIKSMGAGKGNLNDAVVNKWSSSVQDIKDKYPNIKVVIPGHGAIGGSELLDYTSGMFRLKNKQ